MSYIQSTYKKPQAATSAEKVIEEIEEPKSKYSSSFFLLTVDVQSLIKLIAKKRRKETTQITSFRRQPVLCFKVLNITWKGGTAV